MGGEKVVRMLVNLTIGVWIIRFLGPEEFGVLSFCQSLVFIFSTIGSFGLDRIVVRELVKKSEEREVILGSAFAIRVLGAFLVFPLLGAALWIIGTDRYVGMLSFIIALGGLFQSFAVIDYDFQARIEVRYVAIGSLIALLVSSLLKVVLIVVHAPLLAFVGMLAVDALFVAISLLAVYANRGLSVTGWRFDRSHVCYLISESWPLALTGILVAVYMRIDQIMLERMAGYDAVGIYSAAVRLSEVWYLLPVVATASLFPGIVALRKSDPARYAVANQTFFDAMAIVSYAIMIPGALLAPFIVNALLGETYSASATVLSLHIWAGVFVCFNVVSGGWYSAEGLQRMSFYRSVLGCLANVLLNLVLIPRYGAVGAAGSTVFAIALSGYFFDALSRQSRALFATKTRALNVFAGAKRLTAVIREHS